MRSFITVFAGSVVLLVTDLTGLTTDPMLLLKSVTGLEAVDALDAARQGFFLFVGYARSLFEGDEGE
jgi:hypothetical protein